MFSLPTIQHIIDGTVDFLAWALLLFPILSIYVTWVNFQWWRLYKPSPLVKHLLISSIAVDIASIILAFLAAISLDLIKIELLPGVTTILVAVAILISLGVKVYRRVSLRALDTPDVDVEPKIETQDQREDREFGEQRRELEVEHVEENQVAD